MMHFYNTTTYQTFTSFVWHYIFKKGSQIRYNVINKDAELKNFLLPCKHGQAVREPMAPPYPKFYQLPHWAKD